MAEISKKPRKPAGGLSLMGQPISAKRRARAYEHAREMGLDGPHALDCVDGMAEAYGRDQPYEAQEHSMKYLDLTGHYRLMAALLATERGKGE